MIDFSMLRRMAGQCGLTHLPISTRTLDLARAIWREAAKEEREACAKVCDSRVMGDNNREDMEAKRCAEEIRERGR